MRRRSTFSSLRWISIVLIFAAVALTAFELVRYSRIRANFPQGMRIADLDVSGLDRETAAQRLLEVYSSEVELHYGDAVIQVKPATLGFELNLESMLTAADIERIAQPFWTGFWDYLWNRQLGTTPIPLRATISEDRMRAYLKNEIAARYDQPAKAAVPVAGSVNFEAGSPGSTLDIDRAVQLITSALQSPTNRTVNLTYQTTIAPKPSFQNLEILLQQIIKVNGYDGLIEIYLEDLQSSDTFEFAYQKWESSVHPTGYRLYRCQHDQDSYSGFGLQTIGW